MGTNPERPAATEQRGPARSDADRPDRDLDKSPRGESRKDARDGGKPSNEKAADRAERSTTGRSNSDDSPSEKVDDGAGKKDPRATADRDRQQKVRDKDKDPAQQKDQPSDKDKDQAERKDQRGGKDKDRAERKDQSDGNNKSQAERKDETGDKSDRKDQTDQAQGEVRPEDRQKAEQVRSKVDASVRERVRDVAFRGDVRRADRTDIRIDIGVRLPRVIEVYTLPPDIIEVAPAYRGYSYIVIGDDYCIVDPETHVIIDIIPRRGGGRDQYAYRSGGGSSRLDLTNEQIEIIRRETRNRGRTYDFDGDLEVGIKLPGEFAFELFPDTVIEAVPVVRNHRFVHVEDEIAIVAQDQPDVVYVIGD
jgi:hypothetical protein